MATCVCWPSADFFFRSARDEWFNIIKHCLLPRLPFPSPAGFTYSSLSSSLRPPASLPFWQLFLLLVEPPTDSILLWLWLFIPWPSLPPLCLLLIVIRGTWHFLFHIIVKRGAKLRCPLKCRNKKKEIRDSHCLLFLAPFKLDSDYLCFFCAKSF